ncbi:hypothetical protein J8F10_26735 [Gemmata sp. G18]|uniref:Band 7 domain-containing protein n=1 Tax=Gemmata palustris TaxID=2822762 RepID=A0ABS5BYS3_9BACT|nr:hypothetical protein [Gemmata palustris]MBP3958859.1 hypothetical protein [Gemmata palustris]
MTPEPPSPAPPRKRRTRLIIALVLVLSGWAVALFALTRAPKSESEGPGATVVFHINRTPPVLFPGQAVTDPLEFESYRQAQAIAVRRRLTLNSALKSKDIAQLSVVSNESDPVAWLEDALRVSFDPSSEYMRVELDGEAADELVAVLNALTKAYLMEVEARDNRYRRERLKKLEDVNRGYRTEVDQHHKRIDTIATTLGSRDGTTLAIVDSFIKDDLRAAMRDLQTLQDQRAVLEADPKAVDSPEAKSVRAREHVAQARVDANKAQVSKSNEYRIELGRIQQSIRVTERLRQKIADEIEMIKINLDVPGRVTVSDPAFVRSPR